MTWGQLADAVHTADTAAPAHRDLAQVMDQHIAWHDTGTGPSHAMGLPALFSVVRLIASTIDQLHLTTSAGDAPPWLRYPQSTGGALDQGDLVQFLVTQMCLEGHGYVIAERTNAGWRLDAAHNGSVGCSTSTFGLVARSYTFNGSPIRQLPFNGLGVEVGEQVIVPVPYLVTPAHPEGTSPVASAWQAIAGYLAAEKQAANLLDSGTYVGGRLETDQAIAPDAAERWQAKWVENRRQGKIPVLGSGLRYAVDLVDPAQAQFLESRLYNAQSVAGLFGVPVSMLGMTSAGGSSSLSYSNQQDQLRAYRISCLEAFTSQLGAALTPLLRAPGRTPAEAQHVIFDYTAWEANALADTNPAD